MKRSDDKTKFVVKWRLCGSFNSPGQNPTSLIYITDDNMSSVLRVAGVFLVFLQFLFKNKEKKTCVMLFCRETNIKSIQ